ncbi:MAG: hypothetical protein RI539_08080, partial [Spiribacter sp.]|nr:hypothetical protein [Spiribacter sp.]
NMMSWWYAGGGRELYRELTQDIMGMNVVGAFGFPMPSQPFGWFKDDDVTSVDDIQGLKYRTVGLAADLLQEMGMSVAQLPGGEIVPAMERGVIDAFEFNNPSSDSDFGAQDVAKNYYLGSYHQASRLSGCLTAICSKASTTICRQSCCTRLKRLRRRTRPQRWIGTRLTLSHCRPNQALPCIVPPMKFWPLSLRPGVL